MPFRLLEPVPELSGEKVGAGDTPSGNLIVQGDNLHALKALLPRYAGQVKCIYIDPPYNTGNKGWAYNDTDGECAVLAIKPALRCVSGAPISEAPIAISVGELETIVV